MGKRRTLRTPGGQRNPTSKTRAKKQFGDNTKKVVKKLRPGSRKL